MKRIILLLNLALAITEAQAQTAVQAWVQRYNGSQNLDSKATAIAVDSSGKVFVTGDAGATIAYSSAGLPLWTNRYSCNWWQADMVVDTDGNVFVAGSSIGSGSSLDYATIKYSNAGVPLWTNYYNGPGNGFDEAHAVAVDTNGNVFVTGSSRGSSDDYATIAYSSAGVPLWTNRYNGPWNADDSANAITVDGDGDILVTGASEGDGSHFGYATIKCSNAGVPLWTNRYAGPAATKATAIAADGSGNVFVTGTSFAGGGDYATITYSSAGVPLWTNSYNGPANNADAANAIAVDANGNVFVTGYSWSGSGFTFADYATIKYSNAGVPLWTNRYNGPGNGADEANAIAVDNHGDVFVAGHSSNGTNNDYVTIAYSDAGVPLWTNRYDGPGNGDDQASAIAIDGSGNVFVTGCSWNGTNYDYATLKYSLTVPLEIQQMTNQVVLTWTNSAFSFQSAPAITGTFTNVPGATSPYTNPVTGTQQFFRLISN